MVPDVQDAGPVLSGMQGQWRYRDACGVAGRSAVGRDEGKQAIIDWFRRLEIEEWPAVAESDGGMTAMT